MLEATLKASPDCVEEILFSSTKVFPIAAITEIISLSFT